MTIHRLVAQLADMNTKPHALILALAVCACLSACNKRPSNLTPPEGPKVLNVHINEEFKDAYDRTIDFGGIDWTKMCSYKFGYPSTPTAQYRFDARYFKLSPNELLLELVRRSKTEMVLDSPNWDSLSDRDCILWSIGITNSRMLRHSKSEKVYHVAELRQSSEGATTLSGFTEGKDSEFLYTGMTRESALQHIALSGISRVATTDDELRNIISKLNQLRQEFPAPKHITPPETASFISTRLPNHADLHIQFTSNHPQARVETMIYVNTNEKPSTDSNHMDPDLRFLELQMINLTKPVLSHWQEDDLND